MQKWNKIIDETEQLIVMLRQNKDEADPLNIVKVLSTETKKFIENALEKENTQILTGELIHRLQKLREAYTGGDIILLADILEYEILDMIYYMEENS